MSYKCLVKAALKALLSFTVGNTLFIGTYFLWQGFVSDEVEVEAVSDTTCRMIVNDAVGRTIWDEVLPGGGQSVVVKCYLPSSVSWHQMSLRFRGASGSGMAGIKHISVTKGRVGIFTFDGESLEHVFAIQSGSLKARVAKFNVGGETNVGVDDESGVVVAVRNGPALFSGRFNLYKPRRVIVALGIVELVLLALAIFSALFNRKRLCGRIIDADTVHSCLVENFVAALLATLFFSCILPMQSFLANRSFFDFTGTALTGAIIFRFILVLVIIFAALSFCSLCFGRRTAAAILVAFVFCCYLESGPLAVGLPTLNGNPAYFVAAVTRARWDLVILTIGFFAIFLTALLLRKGVCWCAFAVAILILASCFDVRREHHADSSVGIVSKFHPTLNIARGVRYSMKGNVLVFVLDGLTAEGAHDAVEKEPALKAMFPGFTEFTENVGMYAFTDAGVAGMLTGKYFENPLRETDYYYSIFTADSVLKDALDANMSVFFMPGSYKFGYTTGEAVLADESYAISKLESNPLQLHSTSQQAWSLDEIAVFRIVPFIAKRVCHALVEHRWFQEGATSERVMFPILAKGSLDAIASPSFLLSHTRGTHVPMLYRHDGSRLPEPSYDYADYVGQARYVLRQLGELFSSYRKMGIYDSSTILVLADHGGQSANYTARNAEGGMPVGARPCLWVKPAGTTGSFVASDAPTSHSRIATFLKSAISGVADVSLLVADEREFRVPYGAEYAFWRIDRNGKVETGRKQYLFLGSACFEPLVIGKRYELARMNIVAGAESCRGFLGENLMPDWHGMALLPGKTMAKINIKAPQKDRYTVVLVLTINRLNEEPLKTDTIWSTKLRDARLRFASWAGGEAISPVLKLENPVEMHINAEADNDGMISIIIERLGDASLGQICFISVELRR